MYTYIFELQLHRYLQRNNWLRRRYMKLIHWYKWQRKQLIRSYIGTKMIEYELVFGEILKALIQ